MSAPAIAKSLIAAISSDAAGLPKADKRATEKPARPFAQTPAMVNTRQAIKTDNVLVCGERAGKPAADDISTRVTAALPKSTRADVPPVRGEKATASSGMVQNLEALMQQGGCDARISPPPVRLGKQQHESPAADLGTVTKEVSAVQGKRAIVSKPDEAAAAVTRCASQVPVGKGLKESAAAAVSSAGAAPPTKAAPAPVDRSVPFARQAARAGGGAVEVASREAEKGARDGLVPEKTVAASKEHVPATRTIIEPNVKPDVSGVEKPARNRVPEKAAAVVNAKPAQTKQTTIRPDEESKPQQATESVKSQTPRIERRVPQNLQGMQVEKGKPSAQTAHQAKPGAHDRASETSSGDAGHVRHADGGAALSTTANEPRLFVSGDQGTTQPASTVSPAEPSAVLPRVASSQVLTGGQFEHSAGKGPAQSISEQISDSLRASLDRGERQVVVRLRPPELGSVLVRFREENEQLRGMLQVSRGETMRELEQALPQVLRNLEDLGVQVRKLEVTVSEQAEKDALGQSSHQDAWSRQEGSDQPNSRSAQSPGASWSLPEVEPQGAAGDSARPAGTVGAPAGRIDMLA